MSRPSELMRLAYDVATLESSIRRLEKELLNVKEKKERPDEEKGGTVELILEKKSGKVIAEALEVPALEEEIERSIWQVKRALRAEETAKGGRPSR